MKHLISFSESLAMGNIDYDTGLISNIDSSIREIFEEYLFQDFFDEFNYEKMSNYIDNDHFYNDYSTFNISRGYYYGAYCIHVNIYFRDIHKTHLTKFSENRAFKNFDLICDEKMKSILEQSHQRVLYFINPVFTLVGSLEKDLSILYFFEKPNFKRYSDVDIYGPNCQVDIPGLCKLSMGYRHDNGFVVNGKNNNVSLVYLSSYRDGKMYYAPNFIFPHVCYNYTGENPIENWIEDEWKKMCEVKNIKYSTDQKGTMVRSVPQVITPEFMVWLKNNSKNYKKYEISKKV